MHLGNWSKLRVPRGTVRGSLSRRPSSWRAPVALALACLTMAVTGGLPASAAETSAPNVIVHQDILNNLDWAAAAASRIRSEARALATEGTTLKQPPASPPVSYVLIEPERVAPQAPPTRKPTAIAESPEPPAPAEDEVAPATLPDSAEASGGSAAPAIEAVVDTATAQETATPIRTTQEASSAASEAPPVIPAPPEPAGPVTVAEDPIVAPSPPDPQPALPESVVLAEAAPEPEPEPEPLAETPKAERKPAKKSKAKKTQTALRLPAALKTGEVRLVFPQGSVDLSESAKEKLGALAQQLRRQSEADRRIQLQAFASSSAANASAARRLSLARALAVRTFLIEKGIRSRRIDVRALGVKSDEGPPDRVDILDARS